MELLHSFVSVRDGEILSYGGSQSFGRTETMRRCGCGVVAVLDFLLYLQQRETPRYVSFLPRFGSAPVGRERYAELLQYLSRHYLPLVYPTGINGLVLAAGVNLLFLREGLPYRAVWRMTRKGLWSGLDDMLARDLPVIFSVGPNFPRLLSGKERVNLYRENAAGTLFPSAGVHAHFMSVTGRDEEWLRISSWGREYRLRIRDFEEYVRQHSSYLFSNILYIEEKGK